MKTVKRKRGRPAQVAPDGGRRVHHVAVYFSPIEFDSLRGAAGLVPLGVFVRDAVLRACAADWLAGVQGNQAKPGGRSRRPECK